MLDVKAKVDNNTLKDKNKHSLKLIFQNFHRKVHTIVYLSQVASFQDIFKKTTTEKQF